MIRVSPPLASDLFRRRVVSPTVKSPSVASVPRQVRIAAGLSFAQAVVNVFAGGASRSRSSYREQLGCSDQPPGESNAKLARRHGDGHPPWASIAVADVSLEDAQGVRALLIAAGDGLRADHHGAASVTSSGNIIAVARRFGAIRHSERRGDRRDGGKDRLDLPRGRTLSERPVLSEQSPGLRQYRPECRGLCPV